ncbi:MAG: hypothetical protein ACYDCG_04175 [Candidatus Acidiferrales bacterium]
MGIGKILVVIGIVLIVAALSLGYHCWVIAVEAFLRLAAVVLISAGEMYVICQTGS